MWPWVIQPSFLFHLVQPHKLERQTPFFIMENETLFLREFLFSLCLNIQYLDHVPFISSSLLLDISFVSLFSFTSFDPTGNSFKLLSFFFNFILFLNFT